MVFGPMGFFEIFIAKRSYTGIPTRSAFSNFPVSEENEIYTQDRVTNYKNFVGKTFLDFPPKPPPPPKNSKKC